MSVQSRHHFQLVPKGPSEFECFQIWVTQWHPKGTNPTKRELERINKSIYSQISNLHGSDIKTGDLHHHGYEKSSSE